MVEARHSEECGEGLFLTHPTASGTLVYYYIVDDTNVTEYMYIMDRIESPM